MKTNWCAVQGFVLAICLTGFSAAAQPEGDYSEAKPPRDSVPATAPATLAKPLPPRDPTQPGPRMRELLGTPSAAPGVVAPPMLPSLALRSRIIGADGEGGAILEIDNRRLLVQVDTEFTWSPVGGTPQLMRIVELNAQHVVVEFSQLNRKVVLR